MAKVPLRVELFGDDKTLGRNLDSVGRKLDSIGKKAMLMGAAVGGAMLGLVQSAANYGEQIHEAAKKTGLATEAISRLRHAADLCGVNFESLEMAMLIFNRRVSEAREEGSELNKTFKAMGLELKGANGEFKTAEALFHDVADVIGATNDSADRTRMTMELFGRSGGALVPMFERGSAAIKELGDRAEALGLVFSPEEAAKMDEYNDMIMDLKKSFIGLGRAIAESGMIDGLTDLVLKITEFVGKIREFAENHPTIVSAIGKIAVAVLALGSAAWVAGKTIGLLKGIGTVFGLGAAAPAVLGAGPAGVVGTAVTSGGIRAGEAAGLGVGAAATPGLAKRGWRAVRNRLARRAAGKGAEEGVRLGTMAEDYAERRASTLAGQQADDAARIAKGIANKEFRKLPLENLGTRMAREASEEAGEQALKQMAKTAGKTAAKTAGKMAMRALPVVGTAMDIYEGGLQVAELYETKAVGKASRPGAEADIKRSFLNLERYMKDLQSKDPEKMRRAYGRMQADPYAQMAYRFQSGQGVGSSLVNTFTDIDFSAIDKLMNDMEAREATRLRREQQIGQADQERLAALRQRTQAEKAAWAGGRFTGIRDLNPNAGGRAEAAALRAMVPTGMMQPGATVPTVGTEEERKAALEEFTLGFKRMNLKEPEPWELPRELLTEAEQLDATIALLEKTAELNQEAAEANKKLQEEELRRARERWEIGFIQEKQRAPEAWEVPAPLQTELETARGQAAYTEARSDAEEKQMRDMEERQREQERKQKEQSAEARRQYEAQYKFTYGQAPEPYQYPTGLMDYYQQADAYAAFQEDQRRGTGQATRQANSAFGAYSNAYLDTRMGQGGAPIMGTIQHVIGGDPQTMKLLAANQNFRRELWTVLCDFNQQAMVAHTWGGQ